MHRKKYKSSRYFEEKFTIKRMVKRNKQFFDIEMISDMENHDKKRRRTPFQKCEDVDDKIRDSFMNSTNAFSSKVDSAIEKCRMRIQTSIAFLHPCTESHETISREKTEGGEKAKIYDWQKMLSRNQLSKSNQRESTKNQQRYNNFYLTSCDDTHTHSFDKYPPRLSTEPTQTIENENSVNIDKVCESIQKFKYHRTVVPWDYKRQKWDRGPIYTKTCKNTNMNVNQMSEGRINKVKKKIIPDWNKTLINFNKLSSKETPSQFQRNFHSPNCNYRQRKHTVYVKPESKKIQIKKSGPYVQLKRQQVCDGLYFRRKMIRDKKVTKLLTQ